MDYLAKADRILQDARDRLRVLAAESLESNDFAAVGQIAELAKTIESVLRPAAPDRSSNRHVAKPADVKPVRSTVSGKRPQKSIAPDRGHPVYCREEDDLVKISKSRKGAMPYEHRAPRRVLDLLAARITTNGSAEKLFRVDEILPLRDPVGGRDIPSYQAYVCLGWLKDESLLRQHGRRGYTVPEPAKLKSAIDSRFERLQVH